MSDLVKRLQNLAAHLDRVGDSVHNPTCTEAAATIEAQAAEIERLREAVKGSLVIVNAAVDARKQAESALEKAVEFIGTVCDDAYLDDYEHTYKPTSIAVKARAFIAEHGSDSREGK